MTIIAKSVVGQEYLYKAASAIRVSRAKAQDIVDALNRKQWQLPDGYTWFTHEVDRYDKAYDYAMHARITCGKRGIRFYHS